MDPERGASGGASSCRRALVRRHLALACAVAVAVALATTSDVDRAHIPVDTYRVVASSGSAGVSTLSLSTRRLGSDDDPWKRYLADETQCPGGDRTDLPVARRLATVGCLVNVARKRRGLRPLAADPVLNEASLRKARAIVRCQQFAHDPCGVAWTSAALAAGYHGPVGENLYIATGRWGAPRVAVDAWLNSAAHRRNLFGTRWRVQGMALLATMRFAGHEDISLWVSVLGG